MFSAAKSLRCLFALIVAATVWWSSNHVAEAARVQVRTVYVSATDKDGAPLKKLSAADLEVKEGGKVREIVDVKPATKPIRMAILVADGGSGGFGQGMAALLQKLQGETEMSLVSVVDRPERIVDYTNDVDKLVAGIQRLGPRNRQQASGQLMEAIVDTLTTLPRPGYRPVIVVMRTGGAAATIVRADIVRDTVRKTGTRLYVLAPAGAGGPGGVAGGGGSGNMGQARADYAAAESASRGRDLELVLNDGSKESGGRYEQITNPTLLKAADRIADELLAQHEVSYALPDGVDADERVEVTTKLKDVKVQAPTRIAT
jgi:hypothetical protein